MVGGKGGAAQVGPAINPLLPEVGVGEEALPPADALQGRIAEIVGALVAAGLTIPEAGIEAAVVTAVDVPWLRSKSQSGPMEIFWLRSL